MASPRPTSCAPRSSSSASDFPRPPRTTLNGFAPGIQIAAKMRPRSRSLRPCPRTDAPDGPRQSTPCRFRFTLSQTRTISAKRAEVHQNLSRRPSPHGTATRRWPVKCRRGHHGVQTRGARAAYHGIEDERRARQRALSRSVGTADRCAVTGRCRLLANRAVSRGADWPGQRTAAQVRPAADQERRRPGRHLRRFSLGLRQRRPRRRHRSSRCLHGETRPCKSVCVCRTWSKLTTS